MLHLVLRAATQKKHFSYGDAYINFENKRLVRYGNTPTTPLPEKEKQTDILCCMRQYVTDNPFQIIFEWTIAHQDAPIPCKELPLVAQLSTITDELAKKACSQLGIIW